MSRKSEGSTERFKTHANYLRAFCHLIPSTQNGRDLEPLRQQFKLTTPMGGKCVDQDAVFKSLQMGWRTELLLDFTSAAFEEDELVRVANSWGVVQVYYLLYHATQAFAQARGQNRTPNHPQTLKSFKSHWCDRVIDLPPWSLARDGAALKNAPKHVQIEDVHSWKNCNDSTSWSLVALALRTTREDAVNRARVERRNELHREKKKLWDAQEAERVKAGRSPRRRPAIPLPALSPAEKLEVERSVRAHTMMDYIHRLRMRTNYEDSAMFTDGPTDFSQSLSVRVSLQRLSAATMLVHELAIADLIGAPAVIKQATSFLKKTVPAEGASGLRQRLELIAAHRG